MRRLVILLGIIISTSGCLFAQQTVTGKVTDRKTGNPVSGASVKVKSTGKGTQTNSQGSFTIQAASKDILEISSIGFGKLTVPVNGQTEILAQLEAVSTDLGEVVVVGSRGAPRVRTESPVPVDVIKVNQIGENTAKPDLMSQLNMAVPSFNYNKQSGGDGSDAIDFASLRGLGFDQTLVLINGKRRHLSAFVNELGTRGRGNSGTDLNAIPEASIDRIEILRDGASAQYGSDAIAGVINIILKKDVKHFSLTTGGSGYYDHKYNAKNNVDPSQYYTGPWFDGKSFTLGMDYGIPIGKSGGFLNVAGNFFSQGKTYREIPDTNVTTNPKALGINYVRRAFGDGAVTSGGVMLNSEIPLAGTKTTFYFFGGYNYKHSNVYAYTRNFSGAPQKFPTDAQGNLIFNPDIMRISDPTPGQLDTANVYYNPQENVYIKDGSFALGFRGTLGGGWDWDLSNVTGYNDFHYHGYKTFNASLPQPLQSTKTSFDDGGFNFLQNTANLDLSKHFSNVAQGLTLSMGAEFRYERYQIYAGEPDSYLNGGAYFVQGGDTTFKSSGSQGYPGYQPSDEVKASRTNLGGYVDLSLDVTKNWLLDVAARFENYSDFGFVNTYKLATRYKLSSDFNLRGSISTGFRAPSLQQIYFSNTNTNIVNVNGIATLVYSKLSPNNSPITQAAGVPKLTQETSTNGSLGFSWKPMRNLTLTVDGYWVQLKNRVVISGNFGSNIAAIQPYLTQYNVSNVNFFANAVNTTNTGIDIVLDYNKKWGKNNFKFLLAGNIQHINIDKINIPGPLNDNYVDRETFFSTREATFLKSSAPTAKFSLNLEYGIDKFAVGTHLTYFGRLTTQGYGAQAGIDSLLNTGQAGDPNVSGLGVGISPYVPLDNGQGSVPEIFVFHGKITTDIYVSYKFNKHISWVVGVDNLFNVHPDQTVIPAARGYSYDSESGGPFDAVQMGFNGTRLFTKFAFNF